MTGRARRTRGPSHFRPRKAPYAPLTSLLAAQPQVARHLKHRRSPHRYEHVRTTLISNPVRGCHVYGIFVVELAQLAAMMRGEPVDYVVVQDFFAFYPGGERRPKLYSGLTKDMRQFCDLYRGQAGNGYGCKPDRIRSWICGDHHLSVEQLRDAPEGRLRAAFNGALGRARVRLRDRRRP